MLATRVYVERMDIILSRHMNKVTTVVAAITGSAGLISTIEAAKNSKQILLANKESMVMAGALINKICAKVMAQL